MRSRCLLALAVTGCAPNLSRLATDHHYREAICGAHDGSSTDRAEVGHALDGDTAVMLHVRMLQDDELAPFASSLAGRARFARVVLQTNALPVDGLDVSVAFTNEHDRLAELVAWEPLARVTGETLPAKRETTTYATRANGWRVLGAFFTLGTSLLVAPLREGSAEVDAPDADYLAVAPVAHALYHAMPNHCDAVGADGELGASCHWFFVVPRRAQEPVRLDVKLHYTAHRRDRSGEPLDHDTCVVERVHTIELGKLDALDATTKRVFGAGMRPLAELTQ